MSRPPPAPTAAAASHHHAVPPAAHPATPASSSSLPAHPPPLLPMPPPSSSHPSAIFTDPLAEPPGAISLREEGQNLLRVAREIEAWVGGRAKACADEEQQLHAQLQADRKALAACVEKRRADRAGARQHLAQLLLIEPGGAPVCQQEAALEAPSLQKLLRPEATFYELLDLHANADAAAIRTRTAQLITNLLQRKSAIDAAIGRVQEAERTLTDALRRAQYDVTVGSAEQVRNAEWAQQMERASRLLLGGKHEEQVLREEALSKRESQAHAIRQVREALFNDMQLAKSWVKTQLESRWVRQALEAVQGSDEAVKVERVREELMQWEREVQVAPPSVMEGEMQKFLSTAVRLLQLLVESIPNEASETSSDGRMTSSGGMPPPSGGVGQSSVGVPSSNVEVPSSSVEVPSSNVEVPSSNVEVPSSSVEAPSSSMGMSSSSVGVPSSSIGASSSSVGAAPSSVRCPPQVWRRPPQAWGCAPQAWGCPPQAWCSLPPSMGMSSSCNWVAPPSVGGFSSLSVRGGFSRERVPSSSSSSSMGSRVAMPPSRVVVSSSSVGMSSSSGGVAPSSVGVPSSSGGVAPSSVGVPSSSGGVAPSSVGVPSSSVGVPSSSVGVSSSSVGVTSSSVGVSASRVAMVSSSDKDASSGEAGSKASERIANRKLVSKEHAGDACAVGTSKRPTANKRPRPENKRSRSESKRPRPEKKRPTHRQARTMLVDSAPVLQKWNAVLVKRKAHKRTLWGVKNNNTHVYPAVICDIQGHNHVKVLFDDGKASQVVKRSNVRLMPNEEHPERIAPHLRVNEVVEALDRNSGEWFRAKLERAVQALEQGSPEGLRLWVVYLEDGKGDWLRLHEVRPDSLDWQFEGHSFIGQRVARTFDGEVVYGTITKWLPADEANEEAAIYHMRHDDSDSEDLSEDEVIEARRLFLDSQSQESLQSGEGAPPCSEEGGAPSRARALVTCGDPPSDTSPPARAVAAPCSEEGGAPIEARALVTYGELPPGASPPESVSSDVVFMDLSCDEGTQYFDFEHSLEFACGREQFQHKDRQNGDEEP